MEVSEAEYLAAKETIKVYEQNLKNLLIEPTLPNVIRECYVFDAMKHIDYDFDNRVKAMFNIHKNIDSFKVGDLIGISLKKWSTVRGVGPMKLSEIKILYKKLGLDLVD